MESIEKHLADLDDFLAEEIRSFERSAESARAKQLPKFEIYSRAVAEGYQMIRSWIHVNILQSRVVTGDILTVWMIKQIRSRIPEKLERDILGTGEVGKK